MESNVIQQGRTAEQYPLRLPSNLRAQIKSSAQQNGRSINSEIVFHLMRVFSDETTETKKADEGPDKLRVGLFVSFRKVIQNARDSYITDRRGCKSLAPEILYNCRRWLRRNLAGRGDR
ncbi:Arc family DNA-binding protein [Neorhizobium sp. DAR64860/K0K1]|uniref:Arc family DNA-binding protein n=1 Tax=Neorhizobium sp. DAR64860/K0K1 TaxID=3421955 RepID=UPI003D293759